MAGTCLTRNLAQGQLPLDVVEKLVSVEKVGPVEKTDVHNRAIFDDLTSRNVATYLEKIRCRVFQHNRSKPVSQKFSTKAVAHDVFLFGTSLTTRMAYLTCYTDSKITSEGLCQTMPGFAVLAEAVTRLIPSMQRLWAITGRKKIPIWIAAKIKIGRCCDD